MSALRQAFQLLRARPTEPIELPEPVPLDELPTPALVLELDAFTRNLERMAVLLEGRGKGMRPHAKTHKCPVIARRQLDRGAVGICVAKASEAAALAAGGIDRLLITSPIVDRARAQLLVELARQGGTLDVVIDSQLGLDVLAAEVGSEDRIGILVDIDVSMGRTGIRERDGILALADRSATTPGLRFRGVQHYAGQIMHLVGREARRDRSLALWETVAGHLGALAERGLTAEIVSGGGTGTWDIDSEISILTDLQVGSFIFMDRQYQEIDAAETGGFADFEVALTVLATAISQPRQGLVTVDAGYKAFASDAGAPVLDMPSAPEFRFAGDEHGVLIGTGDARLPSLGERVRLVVPHCDPTVNLYDWYWICQDGLVREVWPVTARGCSW